MKLSKVLENYEYYSGALSAVTRQLCFAGIAVIWVFAPDSPDVELSLPPWLLWPLLWFLVGLALDLFHYAFGSYLWSRFNRHNECEGKQPDDDVFVPREMNWPTNVCFWGKASATIAGYAFLIFSIGVPLFRF